MGLDKDWESQENRDLTRLAASEHSNRLSRRVSLETRFVNPPPRTKRTGHFAQDVTMPRKESAMPKETARKYKPPVHIPLPFVQDVRGLLQVDPKKLPGKG